MYQRHRTRLIITFAFGRSALKSPNVRLGIITKGMRFTRRLTAIALLVLPGFSLAQEPFDGKWQTTVSCEAARDALGYSFRFVSEVKNGKLRGLYGTEGKPSSLLIEGTVSAAGDGKLYATGHTGSKEYVPGRDTPRGSEYNYSIEAHFKDKTGTGVRVEGRPCSLKFEKK
jgi:hypothetical protein